MPCGWDSGKGGKVTCSPRILCTYHRPPCPAELTAFLNCHPQSDKLLVTSKQGEAKPAGVASTAGPHLGLWPVLSDGHTEAGQPVWDCVCQRPGQQTGPWVGGPTWAGEPCQADSELWGPRDSSRAAWGMEGSREALPLLADPPPRRQGPSASSPGLSQGPVSK